MSGAQAGSLHTSSFSEVLAALVRDARTGVLRLRSAGPDGAARGELVLVEGLLVGGAIYRSGGYKGTGDALVDAALCSPEDAQGALEYAAQTAQYVPGLLAEGAARAGVSYDRVVEALTRHLQWVLRTMSGWRAGSWEFLLEGLPAEEADRDSAAARAFLLDSGLDPSSLATGDLASTLETRAAQVKAPASDPDVTRKSKSASAVPAQTLATPAAASAADAPASFTSMDTEPDFQMPPAAPAAPIAGTPAADPPGPTLDSSPWEPDPGSGELADAGGAATASEPPIGDDEIRIPTSESPDMEPTREDGFDVPPELSQPEFAAPAGDLEPPPSFETATPPVFESPPGDLSPPDELEAAAGETATPAEPAAPLPAMDTEPEFPLPSSVAAAPLAPPAEPPAASPPGPSGLGEHDLFADADPSAAAPAESDAPPPEELPAADDESTHAEMEPAGEVDWSAPGGAEAALMEAETLLDTEVLSVMLEMGNSAAATAIETKPGAERVLTGHLVLVDEEGQLAGVVLAVPLREAGYVVHIVRGVSGAMEVLERAAGDGQRPLAIVDLLLKRGESGTGGMHGGLEVASRATELGIPAILLGDTGDDTRGKADAAGAVALLARPLRSELKDEALRRTFVDAVLAAIDVHRPQAEWSTPAEPAEALDTGGALPEESGWDVQEIEKKAEEVEDLPDFAMTDPVARMESLWRETVASLSGPLSRPEVLLQVLRFGAEVLTRAVLFTPNSKNELAGFGQFGIELAPGVDADEAVRRIRLPVDGHPAIAQAISARQVIKGKAGNSEWEAHLAMALGGISPEEVFLGPVFCQGRLAALLYGDMLPARGALPDTTNLEVLLGQAGLALDRAELEARLAALERKDG